MKKGVLIIEDNVDLQEIYRINFEAEGFWVKIAGDWMNGMVKILEENPDIIILDIMMPQINGFELLQTIRDQSSLCIPIIVCSNLNSPEDEKRALELGAHLYLRKSDYEWDEIVQEAIKLLNRF